MTRFADRLVKQGALPASEAMRLLRDVVDALAHAHRHQVVHRDIKPDNVMIAERHAVVMDFGVAKAMSDAKGTSGLTSIGVSLGTPAYMAPEQAAADPYIDHRADIYSVGVLAYEMLTGKPPFEGSPQSVLMAQISTAPKPLAQLKPDVPPAIAQIVMKCLEKDPANRYQTADETAAGDRVAGHARSGGTAPAVASRATRRRRWMIGGAAIVAAKHCGVRCVVQQLRRDRWVHQTALPELQRLVDCSRERQRVRPRAADPGGMRPGTSTLEALWPRFSRRSCHRVDSGRRDGVPRLDGGHVAMVPRRHDAH